jgi:hypothetical protein
VAESQPAGLEKIRLFCTDSLTAAFEVVDLHGKLEISRGYLWGRNRHSFATVLQLSPLAKALVSKLKYFLTDTL